MSRSNKITKIFFKTNSNFYGLEEYELFSFMLGLDFILSSSDTNDNLLFRLSKSLGTKSSKEHAIFPIKLKRKSKNPPFYFSLIFFIIYNNYFKQYLKKGATLELIVDKWYRILNIDMPNYVFHNTLIFKLPTILSPFLLGCYNF